MCYIDVDNNGSGIGMQYHRWESQKVPLLKKPNVTIPNLSTLVCNVGECVQLSKKANNIRGSERIGKENMSIGTLDFHKQKRHF